MPVTLTPAIDPASGDLSLDDGALAHVAERASVFARQLRSFTDKVILASGTILSHSPLDAFGQFRAAAPWVFGSSYVAFRNKYAVLGDSNRDYFELVAVDGS